MIGKNKRCPRCNFKVEKEANVCPKCRLNYVKLNSATNEEARKALATGDKERVVYRKGCPSDIKKWKLLLITIFLGFFGAHHFYTGRKNWGIFYLAFCCVGVINVIISTFFRKVLFTEWYQVFYLLVAVWGVVVVMWIVDIFKVTINKYKIPVSLPRQ